MNGQRLSPHTSLHRLRTQGRPAAMATATAASKPQPKAKPPQTLEAWLGTQRAALQEEREAERAEVTEALSQLSPQVSIYLYACGVVLDYGGGVG